MREHGCRETVSGLGCHDHGCLAYADDATFALAGAAYLRDGLAAGDRVMVVAERPERVLAGLERVPAGALDVIPLESVYDVDQGAYYEDAIERALGDGFRGLRTLAELTPLLAGGPSDDLARWEAQADRIMARRPWSALCCYDRRRVDPGALRDIAAVHPVGCGTADVTPFHLFAAGEDRVALSGDVDTFAAPDLRRALAHADPGAPFAVDLSAAGFVDHNALLALAGDGKATVVDPPPTVKRVAELLGMPL